MQSLFLVMMMQRRHEKYPLPFPEFFSRVLEITNLQHHRQVLDKKYPAENRNEQLFTHRDREHRDDAAQRQAARITHENLGGVSVIPEEADTGSYKSSNEHHHLSRIRDVHDVEVIGKQDIARY